MLSVRLMAIRTILLIAALGSAVVQAQVGVLPNKDVTLKEATDKQFHVGEVWQYKTRNGEERSRLTIVHIDKSPELGIIVHVAVDKIRLTNCNGGPEPDSIPHMPFAKKALEASVTKRVGSNHSLPAFEQGYNDWYSGFAEKKAGVYVITVSDAVTVAEKTYRHGIGCE